MDPRITVIIASACAPERADLLRRACHSVLAGNSGLGKVLVVANGPNCDPRTLEWLRRQSGIEVIRVASPGPGLARRVGAELAGTEFISFLDDDDEYLPDSLRVRVEFLDAHGKIDALVTNGLLCDGSRETRIIPPQSGLSGDPVVRAMQHGWQAGMLTLRLGRVDLSVLHPELRHHEWSYTALRLASTNGLVTHDVLTFRYYKTPGSLSQTAQHVLAEPTFWAHALKALAGSPYERLARARMGQALHDSATVYYQNDDLRSAIRHHLAGLRYPGGMARYGLSARLVLDVLRRTFGRPTGRSKRRI
jgi:glycosyltransferase involved in cell wall biosynthesis